MHRLALLCAREPRSAVAWRGGAPIGRDELLGDVAALTARLPPGRHVLNLAADRYAFMVGFLASAASGRICLLPPSKMPSALTRLHAQYPDLIAVADVDQSPSVPAAIHIEIGTGARPLGIRPIADDTIVAIMFTSGSTGEPSPHPKTWGSLVRGACALHDDLAARGVRHAAVLGTVPAQHMYGFETTIMLPLGAGWPFHAACPLLPADLRDALAPVPGPTVLATTPLHLRAIALEHLTLADIACIISSTMPLARTVAANAESLLAAPLIEIYGCTEAGAIATRRTAVADVWRPLPGVRMHVGEATWCEGGHIDHPVCVADRIRRAGNGGFVLEGRVGDMVKIAGKRASLAALNSLLIAIPGVLDGVFFKPAEDGSSQARLGAIVVAPEVDDQAIVARLAQHIDAAFLPRPLYRVSALPREASGKLSLERLHDLVARLRCEALRSES